MMADDLIERYLQDCEVRSMTPDSIIRYKSVLYIFKAYMAGRGAEIDQEDKGPLKGFIGHMRRNRGASQKTIERYLSTLSSFCDYLIFEGMISSNPALIIRKRYKDNGDCQQ